MLGLPTVQYSGSQRTYGSGKAAFLALLDIAAARLAGQGDDGVARSEGAALPSAQVEESVEALPVTRPRRAETRLGPHREGGKRQRGEGRVQQLRAQVVEVGNERNVAETRAVRAERDSACSCEQTRPSAAWAGVTVTRWSLVFRSSGMCPEVWRKSSGVAPSLDV